MLHSIQYKNVAKKCLRFIVVRRIRPYVKVQLHLFKFVMVYDNYHGYQRSDFPLSHFCFFSSVCFVVLGFETSIWLN